jgi:hypothetical protein
MIDAKCPNPQCDAKLAISGWRVDEFDVEHGTGIRAIAMYCPVL